MKDINKVPLPIVAGKYQKYSERLQNQLPDKKFELKLDSTSEASFRAIQILDSSITHIIRNCIDHGIESIEQRKTLGKTDAGEIYIQAEYDSGNNLTLLIKDDGHGINTEKLIQNALDKNLLTDDEVKNLSEDEKLNLIFMTQLSTKEQVTEISGRGVGMDAVKQEIEALNGSITVSSKLTQGSEFLINLPNQSIQEQI